MSDPHFSLCVYCGSRPGSQPEFTEAARAVGEWIGRHGGQLVYGGGCNGLMGTVAQATLDAGGRVIGVIPKALVEINGRPLLEILIERLARCGVGDVLVAVVVTDESGESPIRCEMVWAWVPKKRN